MVLFYLDLKIEYKILHNRREREGAMSTDLFAIQNDSDHFYLILPASLVTCIAVCYCISLTLFRFSTYEIPKEEVKQSQISSRLSAL